MAIATKVLKNRITSIKNTQKITKAMELVAAAKMRKAVVAVLQSRRYSDMAWKMLSRLQNKTDPSLHPLLEQRIPIKKVLILLITSNRGLCGAYNAQMIQKTMASIRIHQEVAATDLVIAGKKGRTLAYKFQQKIIAEFDKEDVMTQIHEIFPLSRLILDEYQKKHYDKVLIAYTDFLSSLKQKPRVRQILPITEKDDYIGEIESRPLTEELIHPEQYTEKEVRNPPPLLNTGYEYLFEPNPDAVLSELLPRLIEVQIYQAYLEANASEHSARMMTMRNATDAAEEMIFDLQLSFNQARQSNITREIAEIAAGKAVLE